VYEDEERSPVMNTTDEVTKHDEGTDIAGVRSWENNEEVNSEHASSEQPHGVNPAGSEDYLVERR
jgi:hypothetical protein